MADPFFVRVISLKKIEHKYSEKTNPDEFLELSTAKMGLTSKCFVFEK